MHLLQEGCCARECCLRQSCSWLALLSIKKGKEGLQHQVFPYRVSRRHPWLRLPLAVERERNVVSILRMISTRRVREIRSHTRLSDNARSFVVMAIPIPPAQRKPTPRLLFSFSHRSDSRRKKKKGKSAMRRWTSRRQQARPVSWID